MDENRSNEGERGPPIDVSKSTLSANAPVFVPRSFTNTAPPPPPQHHPYQNQSYNYEEEEEYVDNSPQYRFHGTALDRIKQAETTLIANPGSFDDIMKPITDALKTAISNEKTLVIVVEEIFTQCVREANFRYTGARLCDYLSRHLTLDFPGGDFRQQLLKKCHEEHGKRDQLASDPSQRENLQGFMLYLAELLLNMSAADGSRIVLLSVAVKEIILSLLNHPTDSSLKATVQVLKLSGQYLEPEADSGQGEGARPLDEVFRRIDTLLQEETLNTSVRNMLGSVITLRSKDWGRKDSGLNGSSQNNPYAANNPYAQHNPYLQQQQQQQDYPAAPPAGAPPPATGYAPPNLDGQFYPPDQYTPAYNPAAAAALSNGGSAAMYRAQGPGVGPGSSPLRSGGTLGDSPSPHHVAGGIPPPAHGPGEPFWSSPSSRSNAFFL